MHTFTGDWGVAAARMRIRIWDVVSAAYSESLWLANRASYSCTSLNEGVFQYIFTVGGYVRKKYG